MLWRYQTAEGHGSESLAALRVALVLIEASLGVQCPCLLAFLSRRPDPISLGRHSLRGLFQQLLLTGAWPFARTNSKRLPLRFQIILLHRLSRAQILLCPVAARLHLVLISMNATLALPRLDSKTLNESNIEYRLLLLTFNLICGKSCNWLSKALSGMRLPGSEVLLCRAIYLLHFYLSKYSVFL